MHYTAPEITRVLNATSAIQSVGLPPDQKHFNGHPDGIYPTCTLAAYESDE